MSDKLQLERRVKELESENERIREGVRFWSYCTVVGTRKACPEKIEELVDFLVSLGIPPYSTKRI